MWDLIYAMLAFTGFIVWTTFFVFLLLSIYVCFEMGILKKYPNVEGGKK